MEELTQYQTKKYNVNQKIIAEIANLESRAILFSITRQFHTAADISHKNKIPMSTVYKKLRDLEELSLVFAKETKSNEM